MNRNLARLPDCQTTLPDIISKSHWCSVISGILQKLVLELMHNMDDGVDCTLAKFIHDMNPREEQDILEGRSAILSSWRNPEKFNKTKCKVLHLEWSQTTQQDRLETCCAKESR